METSPQVSPQQFADSMKQEFEEFATQVMQAVMHGNHVAAGKLLRREADRFCNFARPTSG